MKAYCKANKEKIIAASNAAWADKTQEEKEEDYARRNPARKARGKRQREVSNTHCSPLPLPSQLLLLTTARCLFCCYIDSKAPAGARRQV